MLVFPQIVTGGSALYPVTRRSVQRTVVNILGDGRADVFADPDGAMAAWELRASGLTLAEWNAIEALFQATSGMCDTFTFLDPTGNLLAESEDFGAAAWTRGGLIQLTAGIGDPLGTTRATRVVNAGQTMESLTQTLNVPGNFHYCVSLWARSAGGSSVTLAAANVTRTVVLGAQWQRVFASGNPGQTTTSVSFGAQLASGASIDLFAMQAEAQLAPSDYRKTGVRGGVYSKARFASDQLTVTAQGTDVYDAVIRIVDTET
jgi:hypothetical protein